MNAPRFYLSYAIRTLRRGGQRTLLALVCVMFGVMSLVAMQLLANVIMDAVVVNPAAQLGADLSAFRSGHYLTGSDIAWLDTLVEEGQIDRYSLNASVTFLMLRHPDSGKVDFVMRGAGIDPAVYPLSGEAMLSDPPGARLQDVIAEAGTTALTHDVAQETGLNVGDTVRVTAELGGAPISLRITGIVSALPDREGDKLIYNLSTAEAISGRSEPVTSVSIMRGTQGDVDTTLTAAGWDLQLPQDVNQSVSDVFGLMLHGAGILGLIVGGIGVGNTMQVSLARRTTEIAMLKTMGYRQRDLLVLFGLEAALLGLAGSALGLVAALGIAGPLIGAFERIGSMLLVWQLDPMLLLGGLAMGTLTTVIFAVFMVARSSSVRPAVLLNRRPARRTVREHLGSVGLFLLLALLFSLLSATVMGSLLEGAGVVGLAMAGFAVFGLLMWGALALFVRLPLPGLGVMRMARNNLKRGQLRAVTAAIALFVGVFAIGIALVVVVSGQEQLEERTLFQEGYNLAIFTADEENAAVESVLADYGLLESYERIQVSVRDVTLINPSGDLTPVRSSLVEGWSSTPPNSGLTLSGQPFGSVADGVYLPAWLETDTLLAALAGEGEGPRVDVTLESGEVVTLPVSGFYTWNGQASMTQGPRGAILPASTARTLTGEQPVALSIMVAAPLADLETLTTAIGGQLENALVFSASDLNNLVNGQFHNLFIFAISVAGLAMVAGAVLIANSVGLALVERTREIGVLKAVGYASAAVLRTLLLEQGLLGLISGAAGISAVAIAVTVLNILEPRAQLTFTLLPSLGVAAFAILLAFGSTALVAWRPVHVRPLEVLRAE